MVRTESTPNGIRGVYVALPDGQDPAGAFALSLDAQGHEVKREPLKRGGGMVRMMAPPHPDGQVAPGMGGAAARPRRPGRMPYRGLPPDSPYTRPDYSYKPNEWNPLEVILDANILRAWVNDGPEAGTTNGQADEDIASYGPVALYVGGSGEVRFKQVELKDLGRRVLPDELVSSRFRMQHINDFYYGWSAAAADINHDGILDIVSGPFYYLGPDYRVSREIYFSKTSDVSSQLTPAMVNFAYDYTGDGWPDVLISNGRPMSLYVNPKGAARRWDKFNVLPTISSEIAVFKDVDGDGKPDVALWAMAPLAGPTPMPPIRLLLGLCTNLTAGLRSRGAAWAWRWRYQRRWTDGHCFASGMVGATRQRYAGRSLALPFRGTGTLAASRWQRRWRRNGSV